MKKTPLFRGVATALVTPFEDNKIDYFSLAKLIELQLTSGTDALVICGTTGESATLTEDEQKELISFAVRQARGRAPVIAGAGSNSTAYARILASNAAKSGADAILSVTPYYNKCNTDGLVSHYKAIADACKLPVIIYNVPTRTGFSVTAEQYARLAEIDGVTAVKEASRDMGAIAEAMTLCGDALDFYSGNDDLTLPILSLGGAGVVSVVSNIQPMLMKKLYAAFLAGDLSRANETLKQLMPTMKKLFSDVNPIPVKKALADLGYIRNELRLPLTPSGD